VIVDHRQQEGLVEVVAGRALKGGTHTRHAVGHANALWSVIVTTLDAG
jgi:hypothetical protein